MSRIEVPGPRSQVSAIADTLTNHRLEVSARGYICRCGQLFGSRTRDPQNKEAIRQNHEVHQAGVLAAAGMTLPVGDPRERFLSRQRPEGGPTP